MRRCTPVIVSAPGCCDDVTENPYQEGKRHVSHVASALPQKKDASRHLARRRFRAMAVTIAQNAGCSLSDLVRTIGQARLTQKPEGRGHAAIDRGETRGDPLRPWLTDVQLWAKRTYRGNPVHSELPGEQLGDLPPEGSAARSLAGLSSAGV